jgi:hypothetical protein
MLWRRTCKVCKGHILLNVDPDGVISPIDPDIADRLLREKSKDFLCPVHSPFPSEPPKLSEPKSKRTGKAQLYLVK